MYIYIYIYIYVYIYIYIYMCVCVSSMLGYFWRGERGHVYCVSVSDKKKVLFKEFRYPNVFLSRPQGDVNAFLLSILFHTSFICCIPTW